MMMNSSLSNRALSRGVAGCLSDHFLWLTREWLPVGAFSKVGAVEIVLLGIVVFGIGIGWPSVADGGCAKGLGAECEKGFAGLCAPTPPEFGGGWRAKGLA